MKSKGYLPEIDSLRAIAIASVLLFHLDRTLLPGGFVGVDSFFVISGFVVTRSLLATERRSRGQALLQFFARRLQRITPALLVMLLLTSLASAALIPAAWLSQRNQETGIAAFFGLSNFLLSRPSNAYFGPLAEYNPFTHTWSLAVEEQFYLLIPFILLFFSASGARAAMPRKVAALIAVLSIASLGVCALWTSSRPTFAFYLLPSRFWELGAGVLLAVTEPHWSLPAREWRKALVGVGLVGLSAAIAFADAARFPFPWALLPVAATALLIAAIAAGAGESVLPLGLGAPRVQRLGRLSYSLYLWHWPVFVVCLWTLGLETWPTRLLATALSLGFAAASFRYVENPARSANLRWGWSSGRTVVIGVGMVISCGLLGSALLGTQALSLNVATREERVSEIPVSQGSAHCENKASYAPLEGGSVQRFMPERCTGHPVGRRLFAVGDSHTLMYLPLLARYAEDSGTDVHVLRLEGCPFLSLTTAQKAGSPCERFARAAAAYIAGKAEAGDIVFLSSLRLPRFTDQWHEPGSPSTTTDAGVDRQGADRKLALEEAAVLLAPLERKALKIVFEAPKPVFRSPPFRCVDWFNERNPICKGGFHLTRQEFDRLRAPVLESMQSLSARSPLVTLWDPSSLFCDENGCDAVDGKRPVFFDGDHLAALGKMRLYPAFAAAMADLQH